MAVTINDFNRRSSRSSAPTTARYAGNFEGAPLLLLTTTGAKTGQAHDARSCSARRRPPPRVRLEGRRADPPGLVPQPRREPDGHRRAARRAFDARAVVLEGEERDRLFDGRRRLMPGFADYERKTDAHDPRDRAGANRVARTGRSWSAARGQVAFRARRATDRDGPLDEHDDPQWIRVLAFAIAAAVAAYGSVGLFLAVVGWYRPGRWCSSGTAGVRRALRARAPAAPASGDVSRAAQIGAVLALVAIVAITAWNVSNASQQVLVIRDGGTYLNAGKWISAHGTLEVKPFVGTVHDHVLSPRAPPG
jgi:hypothetical protein